MKNSAPAMLNARLQPTKEAQKGMPSGEKTTTMATNLQVVNDLLRNYAEMKDIITVFTMLSNKTSLLFAEELGLKNFYFEIYMRNVISTTSSSRDQTSPFDRS